MHLKEFCEVLPRRTRHELVEPVRRQEIVLVQDLTGMLDSYLANRTAIFGTALDVSGDRQVDTLPRNRVVEGHVLDMVGVTVSHFALEACALYSLWLSHQWYTTPRLSSQL